MTDLQYCYVDIFNQREKAFINREQYMAVKQNPKGGKLELWLKFPPVVEAVKELPKIEEVADIIPAIEPKAKKGKK